MRRTALALTLALLAALSALLPGREPAAERGRDERFWSSRSSPVVMPLPEEQGAFTFAVFGDRTGGPPEGVEVLAQAVGEANLVGPDLVMTVGDLVNGYNQREEWLAQWREFDGIMDGLDCPWYPVAGNHDVYWRGPQGQRPEGENEALYETHFGPLWYAFRHKDAAFVVLYTDEGDPRTGAKNFSKPAAQRMSPEQFAWLDETLERSADARDVFVFLHHPRWVGGGYGDDWDRVHARLAEAGNVKAVFAGHIHRMRYDGRRDGIEYFTLATVGGGQSGAVPEAGYLHHWLLVTARETGIDVVSLPVGAVDDPRRITGAVSDQVRALATNLAPAFDGVLELGGILFADGRMRPRGWELELELSNPVSRPVEIELAMVADGLHWSLAPDRSHLVLEPGASETVTLRGAFHGAQALLAVLPAVEVRADYLAEDWRVPLPARSFELPLDPAHLSRPAAPPLGVELALLLDGDDDHLRVPSRSVKLPDGPFTLEAWLNAREFRARQGLVCKTEGSEYGIFVNDGRPEFDVHLDGRYVIAETSGAALQPGTWHHVAGVFDGAELRVYVDGVLVAREAGAGRRTPNELPLIVGADVADNGSATSPFPGAIDEVRLSTVARYTGERFEPARRHVSDGETILLLHMDAELGPWVHDGSPARAHPRRKGGVGVGRGTR